MNSYSIFMPSFGAGIAREVVLLRAETNHFPGLYCKMSAHPAGPGFVKNSLTFATKFLQNAPLNPHNPYTKLKPMLPRLTHHWWFVALRMHFEGMGWYAGWDILTRTINHGHHFEGHTETLPSALCPKNLCPNTCICAKFAHITLNLSALLSAQTQWLISQLLIIPQKSMTYQNMSEFDEKSISGLI